MSATNQSVVIIAKICTIILDTGERTTKVCMDINDIARRAGVSRATVSRYLNNGYVSQEKRRQIQLVIDETGYVPSQNARQLRTGKTRLVGVIIPKINSQSVSRMVAGITDRLAENNYQVVLANTNNDCQTEVSYINLFSGRKHVDGLILIGTVFTPAHLEAIQRLRMPFVVLGQRLDGYPSVYHNDYAAMHSLVSSIAPQITTPGYLGVLEEDIAAGEHRRLGFQDACKEAGIHVRPEALLQVQFTSDAGYFGAEQLLDTIEGLDSIICATDDIAFGAMMCMREYGKRVPEDVQITGFGDSMLSRIIHPSLTTVHLAYKTSGEHAAQLLIRQFKNKDLKTDEEVMSFDIHLRNTTR